MVVFIQDILIYLETPKLHAEHLRMVLEVFRNKQLFDKFEKCDFWLEEVKFLSQVINHEGVVVDPSKTQAVMQ